MSVVLYSREGWGVCECGHYDWQHDDSLINRDGLPIARGEGHGFCGFEDCDCPQFTWVETIPNQRPAPSAKVIT